MLQQFVLFHTTNRVVPYGTKSKLRPQVNFVAYVSFQVAVDNGLSPATGNTLQEKMA
jgi:hypothetical protein